MSAPAVPPGEACPLCQTGLSPGLGRCPACGYDLAGVGGRPLLTRTVFWWTAMGFVAVYLITLVIVALTR